MGCRAMGCSAVWKMSSTALGVLVLAVTGGAEADGGEALCKWGEEMPTESTESIESSSEEDIDTWLIWSLAIAAIAVAVVVVWLLKSQASFAAISASLLLADVGLFLSNICGSSTQALKRFSRSIVLAVCASKASSSCAYFTRPSCCTYPFSTATVSLHKRPTVASSSASNSPCASEP